jgi:lysophospholipase L1-like esterase
VREQRSFERFVALGDSFTEGLDDRRPDGSFRGWADLVAAALADGRPSFCYANLAVRSRRLGAVRTEQLPPALAMHPDLVTIAAGANDIMGWRCDVRTLAASMYEVLFTLAATGATVLLFTGYRPHPWLPLRDLIRRRIASYNALIRDIAARHDVLVVDLEAMPELERHSMWSRDRLHLSTTGHVYIAGEVLRALGLDTLEVEHPEEFPRSWASARAEDLRWGVEHFAPWLGRRLTGRSTGDLLTAKRPALEPVGPSA